MSPDNLTIHIYKTSSSHAAYNMPPANAGGTSPLNAFYFLGLSVFNRVDFIRSNRKFTQRRIKKQLIIFLTDSSRTRTECRDKGADPSLCGVSFPTLKRKFNVVFFVKRKNTVTPQINTLSCFFQSHRIPNAKVPWLCIVFGIAQKIRVSQIVDNLILNSSHGMPPVMAFNFRGFPAPHAFIIAYLIYFVKYETQNIFNFFVFLKSAFIVCRSCNPLWLQYKLILLQCQVEKRKNYQIFDIFIFLLKYQIASNYQIFDIFIFLLKYQITSNYQIFDILGNFYF